MKERKKACERRPAVNVRPGHTSAINVKTAACSSALPRSPAAAHRPCSTVPPVAPCCQVLCFPKHPERVKNTKTLLQTDARHGSSTGTHLCDQCEDRGAPICPAVVICRDTTV